MNSNSTWFHRFLLPGFAFKAVVIGGGYATGAELVTFFMPSGPRGGLYGMLLATVVWSAVCVVTFLYAQQTKSRDYRTFFNHLLGPLWPVFEISFFLGMMVILAVFAAAAGAIGHAVMGWPAIVGGLLLSAAIAAFATFGNDSVERLFKYVSFFLYATYAAFLVLALLHFGARIPLAFSTDTPTTGWFTGGMSYAGYNILGAVTILPVIRHLQGPKDAVIAGALAGPLAMIPAILFFVCMTAFYPEISNQALPSDFMLEQLNLPLFRITFQAMIFAALLESGTGLVHAINERIAGAYQARVQKPLSNRLRLTITVAILIGSIFVADRIGLISLIANGYKWLSYLFLAIYVLPLMTFGLWQIFRKKAVPL
ncbi:MAG: hypothetical protein K2P94_03745 [Rhodospirillaceae bacterium]|nr:hypothetical protein [Rhodospirillaceae bacterium]